MRTPPRTRLQRLRSKVYSSGKKTPTTDTKALVYGALGFMIVVWLGSWFVPYLLPKNYSLGDDAAKLLPASDRTVAANVKYDEKTAAFTYSPTPRASDTYSPTVSRVSSSLSKDPRKGFTVTDSLNKASMKITPDFGVAMGKQQQDRLVYPLIHSAGWLVQTVQATGTKEDLILSRKTANTAEFSYTLSLDSSLAARTEKTVVSESTAASSLPVM